MVEGEKGKLKILPIYTLKQADVNLTFWNIFSSCYYGNWKKKKLICLLGWMININIFFNCFQNAKYVEDKSNFDRADPQRIDFLMGKIRSYFLIYH